MIITCADILYAKIAVPIKMIPKYVTGTITASASSVCTGATITFTAGQFANTSYLWYVNNVATGVTTSIFSRNTFQNNDQVSCYITDALGAGFSNVIMVNVKPVQTPAISITASAANICSGDQVSFTATTVNEGPSPVYQWKVNGVIVGANASSYTTNSLYNNDAVTCTLISSADCAAPQQVSSYTITMNVSGIASPKGKIIATSSSICQGTPVDFSLSMSVGTPITYQWKINGNNITTGSTFTANYLNDQDVISCDVLVNTPCKLNIPFSDAFKITVNPQIQTTVNIAAVPTEVCAGTPVTFTAVTANAGNTVAYQWKINNINAGPNNPVFTTSSLNNNDVITCQITPKNIACLVSSTATSNNLVMTVYDLPVITMPALQSVTLGSSITLNPAVSGNITQYAWSPGTGLNNTAIRNPVATPANNITYTLSVTSSTGCTATGTTSIKVTGGEIFVNNTFTPNADGINDTWVITDLINYDTCIVDVFNRNGTVIFHSIGYPAPWDGRFNNTIVPAGVYYYRVDLKNGLKPLTGSVTIIR